jgi:predicted nucleotidyltransferase
MEPRIPIDQERVANLCRKWRITELALFGSVLRSDFGPQSDVDVLVTFDAGAPWSLWDLVAIRDDFEAMFQRKVDLVEKQAMKNPFRRHAILSSHRVIYAA